MNVPAHRPLLTWAVQSVNVNAVIVVVATAPGEVERVQQRLCELGVSGAHVVSPSDTRRLVLAPVEDDGDAEHLAMTLRSEGMLAVARAERGPRLEAWTQHTRPVTFGERLAVCFAWSEHDRPDVSRLIEIGAGGWSAQHPSTRLLVEQLLARVAGGERVLDVGCGSGVLGLCAVALGAERVIAIDIKESAVDATRRNAALNGLDRHVEVAIGPLQDLEGTFDIVLANVGRAALVELGPHLVQRLSTEGWIAASGISPSQCSLVAGFLNPLVEVERQVSGEWATVILTHRG
jgi:ribosomal protein L11 methylase PrmA